MMSLISKKKTTTCFDWHGSTRVEILLSAAKVARNGINQRRCETTD